MKPITLSDAIYEIESQPHGVISKLFILNLLGSVVSDDNDNFIPLAVYTMDSFPRASQDVKEVNQNER